MSPEHPRISEGSMPFVVHGETHYTWYKIVGDLSDRTRTPLVVLHGGPGFTHDYLLPNQDLATIASIPIIFYDQIGNGRSTHLRDKPQSFWTIDLFVDEFLNLVRHFAIEDNFDILGHSWGGMLGAEIEVRRQPAGLRRLIIADSPAAMSLWQESQVLLKSRLPEGEQAALAAGPAADKEKFVEAMEHFHGLFGCKVKPTPQELLYSRQQSDPETGDRTVADAMVKGDLGQWSIVARLSHVRVPTLLINGRDDFAQDFTCKPYFDGIPKVRWYTFEGSSHTPFWEERGRYMLFVADFLNM
ncbi:uncharacterized protein FIBRA_00426 [Fibroporia radiculosa]|uniref:AB hydrolase-1 domain-containing protein n=1 Tax=Fibroporia radiculosa TaxID=599839 RepID=J4GZZ4_9APHY|nr:uncharacterized protein FIBRA_00426 [Fibroporia radiculosa]CCL98429.1 predicted protein [Fibroporia radiculosa]